MVSKESRQKVRVKKHMKMRNRFSGTAERPRLAVFRSNNHMYAQIIDDTVGNTLVAASTLEKDVAAQLEKTNDVNADALGTVLALAGLATGKIGRVGQGLMIKGQQSMSSDWNKATSVIINRSQNTIKVNERLFKNQVYAADEDFDFVVDFIKKHVSEKCKISE